MAELTVDDIITRLKDLQASEEKLYELQMEHRATFTKLNTDAQLLVRSPHLTSDDRLRLTDFLSEFMAEALKKMMKRAVQARKAAGAQQDVQETAAALGDVSGGFPRLA